MKNQRSSKLFLILSLLSLLFPMLSYAQTPTPSPTPYYNWPREDHRVISTLGSLRSSGRYHAGIDLKRADGQAVYPSADGVITLKAPQGSAGYTITVLHDNGQITNYLHLKYDGPPNEQFPKENTPVAISTQIGEVGGTGGSGAVYTPHLHFEIRDVQPGQTPIYGYSGDARNPLNYLLPR